LEQKTPIKQTNCYSSLEEKQSLEQKTPIKQKNFYSPLEEKLSGLFTGQTEQLSQFIHHCRGRNKKKSVSSQQGP
jgi:hypothetical protein